MRLCRTLVLLLLLTATAPAGAAAAAIDDFNEPGTLSFAGHPTVSNQSFTTQTGEPSGSCAPIGRTGWWRITGTGQHFTITTAGSNFDTVLAAYDSPGAPTATDRVDCNDDIAPGTTSSMIDFGTVRGRSYLLQVGGLSGTYGIIVLSASAPRPANDDRANALAVPANQSSAIDSTGASSEPGEQLTCAADEYGATVWFRFSAPAIGDATFTASANFPAAPNPGDTVMTVYRASDGAVLGCNDDSGAGAGGSAAALRVDPGDYLIQVGGHTFGLNGVGEGLVNLQVAYAEDLDLDRDGSARPGDCRDDDPAIHPGLVDIPDDGVDQDCLGGDAVNLDRDGDGYPRPADCDDGNAAVNPGAPDTPGDGINQDCTDADAPYPMLQAGITGFFAVYEKYTAVTSFLVRRLAAGTKVVVTCKGRGCPFKMKKRAIDEARDRLPLMKFVRKAKLRRGVRLKVKVTKPDTVGLIAKWKIRAAKPPVRSDSCLWPGETKPRSCPG